MLRYLRENTGNWIIKSFLSIIVIVFIFLGVGSMDGGRHNQVAEVNGEAIPLSQYRDAYQSMIQRLQQQFGSALDEQLIQSMNVRQHVVNNLIDQKILDMEARRLDIVVSDKELQKDLLSIKAFRKDGAFDMERYRQVLGRNAMTPDTFEAMQRDAIRVARLRRMVASCITVGDQEARAWYSFNNTTACVNYVCIDPDTFSDLSADEVQIRTQYDEHHDLYMSRPKRKVAFIVFAPADFDGEVTISQGEIQAFYNQNTARFTAPEQVEASHILIRVDADADDAEVAGAKKTAVGIYEKAVKGADFSQLAKTHSQCPSADKGGALGRFDRTRMVKPFADAAFAMKPGEISQPVKTRFGWHVIKVTGKIPETVTPFEAVKSQIQKELVSGQTRDLAYNKAEEAYDAVLDADSFEQVALAAGRQPVTTPAFAAEGAELAKLGITDPAAFAETAFALGENEISEIRKIGNTYYLMQVVEKIAPALRAYEDVKGEIADALTADLRKEAARKTAESILERTGGDADAETFEKVARENHLGVESSKMFTRTQGLPGIAGSAAIAQAAFTLDAGKESKKRVYGKVLEASGKFYIIRLKEKQSPGEDAVAGHLDDVKRQLESRKQREYFTQWLTSLKEKSKIAINTDIIN